MRRNAKIVRGTETFGLKKDGGFIDHVVYCRKKCVISALLNLGPLINNEIEATDELEQDNNAGH
jgi:hypothetical protein